MFLAKVYVTYKTSILDPKGEAIKKAVHQLNYNTIDSVRLGKYFEVIINDTDRESAIQTIQAVSDQLLANVTMESYRYEIEEIQA